jgi:hypothetical protein
VVTVLDRAVTREPVVPETVVPETVSEPEQREAIS